MILKNKSIAFWIPKLTSSVGGAEIYGLRLAKVLSEHNDIVIFAFSPIEPEFNLSELFEKYNVPKFRVEFVKVMHIKRTIGVQVLRQLDAKTKDYDIFINCTQSRMRCMKNTFGIHIIHFPSQPHHGFMGKILNIKYITSYNLYICNSEYTQKYLKEYWGITGNILYPPIAVEPIDFSLMQKEKIILAVARIVEDKKIVEMIDAFKRLFDSGYKEYKFEIIGNTDKNEIEYYNKINNMIDNYPIEIHHDISTKELNVFYQKATFFWHAKGLNEDSDPYKAEHFGMTTVEAMANGCIPIVINKAGQKEIVEHNISGYRWDSTDELIDYTCRLMSTPDLIEKLQINVINRSKMYLMDQFSVRANDLIATKYGEVQ